VNKSIKKTVNTQFAPSLGEEDYYKLCLKCGNFSHINENQIYCAVCGEKLIEACPKCGEKIKNPTAKFCVWCGNKFYESEDS